MFGERLKHLRNEMGLTQQDLAKLLNISPSTVGMYEQGRRDPDTGTINFLASYFRVSADYLLGRSDIRETPEKRIENAISDDSELLEFWQELREREDLQILFKQVRPLSEESIKRIIRYIKMVEDEEAKMDY